MIEHIPVLLGTKNWARRRKGSLVCAFGRRCCDGSPLLRKPLAAAAVASSSGQVDLTGPFDHRRWLTTVAVGGGALPRPRQRDALEGVLVFAVVPPWLVRSLRDFSLRLLVFACLLSKLR